MRQVAVLLRGVNLGGRTVLPMADLRRFLIGLGYGDVRTLIASGNTIVASDQDEAAIEQRIEAASEAALGRALTVLVRDRAALDALVEAEPHGEATAARPHLVHTMFYRSPPTAMLVDTLVAQHVGPERVQLVGRDLVVDYGVALATSKLDAAMRKLKFPAVCTARNWNTVQKLRAALG